MIGKSLIHFAHGPKAWAGILLVQKAVMVLLQLGMYVWWMLRFPLPEKLCHLTQALYKTLFSVFTYNVLLISYFSLHYCRSVHEDILPQRKIMVCVYFIVLQLGLGYNYLLILRYASEAFFFFLIYIYSIISHLNFALHPVFGAGKHRWLFIRGPWFDSKQTK